MRQKNKILSLLFTTIFFVAMPVFINAQVTLDADGPGNTYELINSKLAPSYTAVETPDQCASHPSFGRHIAEVWDATLNKYVFEFYIHVPTSFPVGNSTADNDRCMNYDRQRVEIKTYESSPANLKGTIGETINYKWQFRLPTGFQPSPNFTHIHQIKAVGGDDGDPIFTLTVRAGSPNVLQLLHVVDSATFATTLAVANLSAFAGTWVEATEVIKVGANGTYSINIKRVSDGLSLLSYSISNILTIRPSNTFTRPKWGIYRSLNSAAYLRDDSIRIASISIQEGVLPVTLKRFSAKTDNKKTQLNWTVENEINFKEYQIEYSKNGIDFSRITIINATQQKNYLYENISTDTKQYYRLKLVNNDGTFSYSNIVSVTLNTKAGVSLYPNPAKDFIAITTNKTNENNILIISNANGVVVKKMVVTNTTTIISTRDLLNGIYNIELLENNQTIANNSLVIVR